MCPCCAFFGCCLTVSANVSFDDNLEVVHISNWPGYLCVPPCLMWTTIRYGDIANIGIRNTGISEGSEHNLQPLYDSVLVTRNRKIWNVGERGRISEIQQNVLNLHRFVFGRGNPDYKPPASVLLLCLPNDDACCCPKT